MSPRCTCGAQPPDDARFCHKCGRPLYEKDLPPEPEPEPPKQEAPPPEPAPPPAPPPIAFGNGIAVRCALFAALVASFLTMVMPILFVVVLVAGGFLSVWLYRKRTGEELTVSRGARMGWLTGLFCFVFFAAVTSMQFVALANSEEARKTFIDQATSQGLPVSPEEMVNMLTSPAGILAVLFTLFILLTVLSVIGGAMGAKVLGRE